MSLLEKNISLAAGIATILTFLIIFWKPFIKFIKKNRKIFLKIIFVVIIISFTANIYFIFFKKDCEQLRQENDLLKERCEQLRQENKLLKAQINALLQEISILNEVLNQTQDTLSNLRQEYGEFRTGISQELSQELSSLIAEGNTYGDFKKWSEKSELLLGIIDHFLHCCYNNNTYNYREQFLDSIRSRQGDEITSVGHITQTNRGVIILNNTQEYLNSIDGDNNDNQ